MTTRANLRERIRRMLSGGFPADSDKVQDPEIDFAIGSKMNELMQAGVISTTFGVDDEEIPDGTIFYTYTDIPVTRGLTQFTSYAQMPIAPMPLPARKGLQSVYPSGSPDKIYYPILVGQINQIRNHKMLAPMTRLLYCWDSGLRVTIYDDLIGAGIIDVDMVIAGHDFAKYGDSDILPIAPSMEGQLIDGVLKMFGMEPKSVRGEDMQPKPEGTVSTPMGN